jgi:hypothetical protein
VKNTQKKIESGKNKNARKVECDRDRKDHINSLQVSRVTSER